jgi:magnesium transporter
MRKTLVLEREVLARLFRGEFSLVAADEAVYYRDVYDHLVRYAEFVDGWREMVTDLMQTHLAAVSNRLNEIMKVLTMISIVGVVCSFIAGVWGMNFKTMPLLENEWGFWYSLGMMGILSFAAFAFFRWRKWI